MGLNGIDVSSWQADLDVGALPSCDFVVVKATGGAGYTNESFVRHAEQALAAGRLLGCYRYAREACSEGTARQPWTWTRWPARSSAATTSTARSAGGAWGRTTRSCKLV